MVVRVADTGVGMDAETQARAIEPFFSTKGVGQGTGLGLSMAHGLARQLSGALTIDSSPGAGTSIALWFPTTTAPRPAAGDRPVQQVHAAGAALVVDDEDMVRATWASR